MELVQDCDTKNETLNQVDSMENLFNRVLEKAVVKQHSLEKAAIELQDVGKGIENTYSVLNEIQKMSSFEKTAMNDGELKENIELCQVCFLLNEMKLNLLVISDYLGYYM